MVDDSTRPRCRDCDTGVMPAGAGADWHWYMVLDSVWALAGMGADGGSLCVPCLEGRLGRPLTGSDLTDARVNDPGFCWRDTPRLAALKRELRNPFRVQ